MAPSVSLLRTVLIRHRGHDFVNNNSVSINTHQRIFKIFMWKQGQAGNTFMCAAYVLASSLFVKNGNIVKSSITVGYKCI